MSSPFVAEIRIVGFNFAPPGWAQCNGQLMPISQNTALFSLIGTYYGGDGRSTFGLPNFQGNAGMMWGAGSGLTERFLGEEGGSQTVTLINSEMPFHTHTLQGVNEQADSPGPTNAALARPVGAFSYVAPGQQLTPMAPQALSIAGSSLPHNNMQPYLVLNFIIALQGVFPPRG